jgi:hypothetical protein
MALLHPPFPRRAKTRPFPGFVLARTKPQRTAMGKACLGRLGMGWVKRCASASSSLRRR